MTFSTYIEIHFYLSQKSSTTRRVIGSRRAGVYNRRRSCEDNNKKVARWVSKKNKRKRTKLDSWA